MHIYTKEHHQILSKKIGCLIYHPKTSILDLEDVFNGESIYLLGYISAASSGLFEWPKYVMLMVKTGLRSTPSGRECDYDAQPMVVILDKDKAGEIHGEIQHPIQFSQVDIGADKSNFPRIFDDVDTQVRPVRAYEDSDADSRANSPNFSDVATSAWDESSKADTEPRGDQATDARALGESSQMKEDDRKDRERELSSHIDNAMYVAFTSARLNQITSRWGNIDANKTGEISRMSRRASDPYPVVEQCMGPVVEDIEARRGGMYHARRSGRCGAVL